MLVARPVAVALCLLPFRYDVPEIAFISWVGLRGAVPMFLAIIPLLAGLPDAAIFFGVAFIVVLISLILQGWTVATAARMFDLEFFTRSFPSVPIGAIGCASVLLALAGCVQGATGQRAVPDPSTAPGHYDRAAPDHGGGGGGGM
jgi:hypothetical protein